MVFPPRGFQGKYRLQMEAQHIGLSQIHAAKLELLQEEVDNRTHSLELKLQEQSDHGDRGEGICSLCASGKAEVSFKMFSTLSFMIHPNRRNYVSSIVLFFVDHVVSANRLRKTFYYLNRLIN